MTKITKFQNTATGETVEIKADFNEAASPILARWNSGQWYGTPFQVADASHYPREALKLVLRWHG